MKICLVSSQHVSYNPRLVKEADALVEAGYSVRVVAICRLSWMDREDRKLLKGRSWRLETVNYDPSRRVGLQLWLLSGIRQRTAQWVVSVLGSRMGIAERALGRVYPELRRLAARERADLFLAHNLAALPAASWAAERNGAKLGFDMEDLHSEELLDLPEHADERALVASLEKWYLPRCVYLTAASPGIADEVARRYAVPRPHVILNAFSPSSLTFSRAGERGPLSLFWYSQVIGPGRGLEDAIAAAARLGDKVEIHLQGREYPGYREKLLGLAEAHGIPAALHFHQPSSPDDIVAKAARHDVGLALERREPLNRDLCVVNKIFIYMSAGLAIAASDTRGQRAILETVPEAGFLYTPGDVEGLVRGLERFVISPSALDRARRASRRAAAERYSWDIEKLTLFEAIRRRI